MMIRSISIRFGEVLIKRFSISWICTFIMERNEER